MYVWQGFFTAGLELSGGLLPVRGQVLAVAAPWGEELHQPESAYDRLG